MKNHCGESVGFSFRAALWFRRPVILFTRGFLRSILLFDLLPFLTVKCNDSVSYSFLFPCFFLRSGPNSFFSIKANHCVFELSVSSVYLFHCVIATDFDYRIQYTDRFRDVLHAVDSLNVNHELRSKKPSNSVSCRHFQTLFLGLRLENRVLLFA